jgi:hypothetical protein
MTITERYVKYLMKCECKCCGDSIFHHEDDARSFVEHSMRHSDEYDVFETDSAQSMLSWRPGGKYCDYCDHMPNKDD